MGPVTFVARAQRRRSRLAAAALALVVALVGGLSTALAAGARRASTVVERYYAPATPYTLMASVSGALPPLDQVRAMPGVTATTRQAYVGGVAHRSDGVPEVLNLYALDGPPWDPMIRLRAGTLPSSSDVTSMVVNRDTLRDYGVKVGDELQVRLFTADDWGSISAGKAAASGGTARLRITGVVDTPLDFESDRVAGASQAADHTEAFVPYDFFVQHVAAGDMADFGSSVQVVLDDPGSRPAFEEAFSKAVAQDPQAPPAQFGPPGWSALGTTHEGPAHTQAAILWVLAVVSVVAGMVAVGLMLAAEERLHAGTHPVLTAVGMSRAQRAGLAPRRSLVPVLGGAVLGAGVAVALSGMFPVGVLRPIERDPGMRLDLPVVAGGAAVVALLVLALALAVGWTATRRRSAARARPAATARWLAGVNAPNEVMVGGHLAFPGRGASRSALARQTVGAGVAAVSIVVGVGLYTAGIDHVRSSKAAHGFPWDAVVGNVNNPMADGPRADLRGDTRFGAVADARYGTAAVDGQPAEVLAVAGDDPQLRPEVVAGRAPRAPGEIALGPKLLALTGKHIGDTVRFSLAGSDLLDQTATATDVTLTVVGQTVLTTGWGDVDLGRMGAVTLDGLVSAGAAPTPQFELVRFKPGVDTRAAVAELTRRYPLWMTVDAVPGAIEGVWLGRALPIAGAVVVAILGTVLLAYTLAATARLMRRDLAVLRSLGMRPGGVRNSVVWQGLLLAAVILAVGVPLGLVAGTAVWHAVAHELGVSATVQAPGWLVAVPPATVAVAVLAAAVPASRARRLRVAEALRVE